MSQQKSFSRKMYLPFKQKCPHRQRRRKTSSSQLEQGVEWQRLQFHGKRSALCGAQGERGENTQKATKESSGIRYPLLAPFISATEEQKKQPLHPKGSQSIADSSRKAFYIPGSLTSAWAPRPTAFQLPAALVGETRQMQQQQGVLASRIPGCRRGIHASTRGCSARSLPVPRLAMAATAAAPAPRTQQVQGSGGEEGAAAAAAAGAARLPLLHRVTLS